jgi:elongation factor G
MGGAWIGYPPDESKFAGSDDRHAESAVHRKSIRGSAADYPAQEADGGAGQFGSAYGDCRSARPVSSLTPLAFGGRSRTAFSFHRKDPLATGHGPLAGYPVVDVRCEVYDGKMHPVDSKDIAFQIAGREVFKKTFMQAGPVLLEPIMDVRITVPEEYMGDIMSDLNTRRGRVQGMEQTRGKGIITAQVPMAEMQRYAIDLRSMTQGRGIYTMKLSHYEPVPAHIAEQVIEQAKRERVETEEE